MGLKGTGKKTGKAGKLYRAEQKHKAAERKKQADIIVLKKNGEVLAEPVVIPAAKYSLREGESKATLKQPPKTRRPSTRPGAQT